MHAVLQAAKITGKIDMHKSPAVKGAGSCTTVGVYAYRSLIQLKGGSKGVHESQVEVPSKQLVKVRCCDSIWPADSIRQLCLYHTLDAAGHIEEPEQGQVQVRPSTPLLSVAHFFGKSIDMFVVKG